MSKIDSSKVQFGRVSIDKAAACRLFEKRRAELKMSLRAVAKKADVSLATVHNFSKGDFGLGLENFLRILSAVQLLPTSILQIDGRVELPEKFLNEEQLKRFSDENNLPGLLRELAGLLEESKQSKKPAKKSR
jgi:hypothetical protein